MKKYTIYKLTKLKKCVGFIIQLKDNTYLCDNISNINLWDFGFIPGIEKDNSDYLFLIDKIKVGKNKFIYYGVNNELDSIPDDEKFLNLDDCKNYILNY